MYCNKCGKQIPDGSVFCTYCGANQPTLQQPVYQQPAPVYAAARPPKGSNRGWKTAFFCMLGAAALSFCVFVMIVLLAPKPDAAAMWEGKSIMAQDDIFGNYTAPAASPAADTASEVQTAAPAETSDADAYQRIVGAWEMYEDGSYIGFEFFDDNTARYVEDADEFYYYFTIQDNRIVFEDEAGESTEFEFALYNDGAEYLTLRYDNDAYEFVRVDSLSEQMPALNTDVFANGFETDIESFLADTWWASAGTSVDNPAAAAAAPGYPSDYDIRAGKLQYIFDTDAMTVQVLMQDENGTVTDEGIFDYELDPYGFILYAFRRVVDIEGADYVIQSKFFVCDGVLYEVEMVDGAEASNYVAYSIYAPG